MAISLVSEGMLPSISLTELSGANHYIIKVLKLRSIVTLIAKHALCIHCKQLLVKILLIFEPLRLNLILRSE